MSKQTASNPPSFADCVAYSVDWEAIDRLIDLSGEQPIESFAGCDLADIANPTRNRRFLAIRPIAKRNR